MQNVHCGGRCVVLVAILLEPQIVDVHIVQFGPKNVLSSFCSGDGLKKLQINDAPGVKYAPNSD